jgi:hypothetical protein
MKRLGYTATSPRAATGARSSSTRWGCRRRGLLAIHTNMPGHRPGRRRQGAPGRRAAAAGPLGRGAARLRAARATFKQVEYAQYMAARPQTLYGIADSPVGPRRLAARPQRRRRPAGGGGRSALTAPERHGRADARRDPRQHHALLADEHGRLRVAPLLGVQGRLLQRQGRPIPVAVSVFPASSTRRRGAGRSARTRSSSTTTRSRRAATSRRGSSHSSSHRSCGRRSGRCGRCRSRGRPSRPPRANHQEPDHADYSDRRRGPRRRDGVHEGGCVGPRGGVARRDRHLPHRPQRGDSTSFFALLAPDLEVFAPGARPVRGADARASSGRCSRRRAAEIGPFTEQEITIRGDVAIQRHSYRLTTTPVPGGQATTVAGSGLHVWSARPTAGGRSSRTSGRSRRPRERTRQSEPTVPRRPTRGVGAPRALPRGLSMRDLDTRPPVGRSHAARAVPTLRRVGLYRARSRRLHRDAGAGAEDEGRLTDAIRDSGRLTGRRPPPRSC